MIWLIGFNWTIMSKTNGVAIRDKRGRYLKGMPVAGRLDRAASCAGTF